MKKGKLFKLMMPLLAMVLTGCGGGTDPSQYQKDKTSHWIPDVANSKGEHEFEDAPDLNVAATCKAPGKTVRKCKVCGYLEETSVKKLDHTYVDDATASTAATCKAEGKKVQKCSACGDTKETKVPKLDHDLEPVPAETRTATCSQEGQTVEKCKNCDYKKTTKIEKSAHTLGAGTLKNDNGKEYYEYECSTCHNKAESRVKISDVVCTAGSMGTSGNEKGKLSTDPGVGTWKIQLPAGDYDVYFDMKYSSSGEGKTLSERGVKVTLNGANVSFDDTISDDVIGTSTSEFKSVTFCSVTLTGGVDTLGLQNPYYRYVFDIDNGYVTFVPKASA